MLPIKPKSPRGTFAIPYRVLIGSANRAQHQARPGLSLHVGSLPIATLSADGYYIAPIDETQVRADIEISPVCLTRNGEWVYGAKQTEAQAAEGNIL